MPTTRIYICTHKEFEQSRRDTMLSALLVGAARHSSSYGYLRDDEGENISTKNGTYCELTGLYWMWKNTSDDVVGLCHYRRYFDMDEASVGVCLSRHDVILPKRLTLPFSLRFDYRLRHVPEDFGILQKAVHDFDSSYDEAFESVMSSNRLSPYNMFVMPRELMERYCGWLFGVLGLAEKEVVLSGYAYQRRVFGFMSERLMEVFVRRNGLRVFRADVVNTEARGSSRFRTMVGDCVREVFFLSTRSFLRKQIE